jgi:hypothetical protein
MISALVFMLVGWGGLYLLVTNIAPYVGPRWAFLALLLVAVTGTVLPFVRFLNIRFTPLRAPLPSGAILVRQSVWFGLFVVICAWMQILRILNAPLAFFVALAFVVLEVFLRSREIAQDRDS